MAKDPLQRNRMTSMRKLAFVAALGFSALLLGSVVLTFEVYVAQQRRNRGIPSNRSGNSKDETHGSLTFFPKSSESRVSAILSSATVFSSGRKAMQDPPAGLSRRLSGDSYWPHAAAFMEWDAIHGNDELASAGLLPPSFINVTKKQSGISPRISLQLAAKAGNPVAQHYMAIALSSGIWPVPLNAEQSTPFAPLIVMDEVNQSPIRVSATSGITDANTQSKHRQFARSQLYWRMAAAAGNIEAAMAMAYHLDQGSSLLSCQESVAYYQAAANGIIDDLESTLHSRAKSLPPQDKHLLAQVHIYGGSSSQLDWNNKPDESKEALQFYHLKATTWQSIDVHAAFTLAHLYHHGMRGVPQNLTLALNYYQIAADHGHWESAGHVGVFYLYGMGCDKDLATAYSYFRIGAPNGLDGCRQRHEQSLRLTQQQRKRQRKPQYDHGKDAEYNEFSVVACDSRSVNGLGMLNMLGIPALIQIDLTLAEKLFLLAKEMGSVDAHYNLAMMWLGWKSHYKKVENLQTSGTSVGGEVHASFAGGRAAVGDSALHIGKSHNTRLFGGPIKSDYIEAIKLLGVAASKGHLQARHRLGIIYSNGINYHGNANDYEGIKPDCSKAKSHLQWIVDYASPHRSKRLRTAYKQYAAGNLRGSLYNYLAAAETGSHVGMSNAAFLLEQGECLGLTNADCSLASVRLWKAAAARGSAEACLRVGDFYYYGPFRRNSSSRLQWPFHGVQHILYPDSSFLNMWQELQALVKLMSTVLEGDENLGGTGGDRCYGATARLWSNLNCDPVHSEESSHEGDLALAARYYQSAVDIHGSPRAYFNLGYMHEWGIGLIQDFPLAKRHYDLAASGNTNEAGFAVQCALTALFVHEQLVKLHLIWKEWVKPR